MANKHLGDKVPPKKTEKPVPEEKWIPVPEHPDYVKSTLTGAIKHKDT